MWKSYTYTSDLSGQEEQTPRAPLNPEESEYDNASLFSRCLWLVVTPLIQRGRRRPLEFNDLMHLPKHFMCHNLLPKLERCYATSKPFWRIPRLGVALLKCFRESIIAGTLLTLASRVRFVLQIILGLFIGALENGSAADVWGYAALYSALLFILVTIFPIEVYFIFKTGLEMKNTTIALLYSRLFSLGNSSLSGSSEKGAMSTGVLMNMISNDVAKFEIAAQYITNNYFTNFFDIAISLIALSYILNVASSFAGVGICLLVIPLQMYIGKRFGGTRINTGSATDKRVRFTSEVISGISSVKSFAWENPFFRYIEDLREIELQSIRESQIYRSINLMFYYAVPAFGLFSAFSVYWAMGGLLTTSKVFSTAGLLYQLRQTTGRLIPLSIMTAAEAIASAERIEKFLRLSDHKIGRIQGPPGVDSNTHGNVLNGDDNDSGVVMVDASTRGTQKYGKIRPLFPQGSTLVTVRRSAYCYGVKPPPGVVETVQENPVLRDVEFEVKAGELVMVVGSVGAGKSSLLSTLLGDMKEVCSIGKARASPDDGHAPETYVTTEGDSVKISNGVSVAFCAQVPWIMASTVRANITVSGRLDASTEQGEDACASNTLSADNSTSNPFQTSSSLKEPLLAEDDPADTSPSDLCAHIPTVSSSLSSSNSSGAVQNCNTPISKYDDFKNPEHINQSLYERATESTCIIEDINQWPNSDETDIGERGISISGGQKARLGLARAVYSDADLYVLDDVLSAVDAEVGRSLFFGCIIEQLRDRKKGVVLSTHQQQYLKYADKVIVLERDGQQSFCGSYEELMERMHEFRHIIQSRSGSSAGSSASSAEDLTRLVDAHALKKIEKKAMYSSGKVSLNQTGLSKKTQWNLSGMGVQVEEKKVGNVEELWNFITFGGIFTAMYAALLVIASQGLEMFAVFWPQFWASERFGSQSRSLYVWVLGIITVACVLMGVYRPLQWYSFTREAGNRLHRAALWAVLHTPLYFFVANPTGRILNRFSMDLGIVDEQLPSEAYDVIQMLMFAIASLLVAVAVVPYLLIVVIPLACAFYLVRKMYTASQQEIKRIDQTTKSPIYSDFTATLEGIQTLRAYNLKEKASVSFMKQIDRNSRAFFNIIMVGRWASFHLDLAVAAALAIFTFMCAALRNSIDVGLAGFALVLLGNQVLLLQFAARRLVEVETQLTSVERLTAYTELEQEDGYGTTLESLAKASLPKPVNGRAESEGGANGSAFAREDASRGSQGARIDLEDLHVRYRNDLDTVLKGVSIHIPAGAKVGICGRTGSGKSTTLLALLRLNLITGGDIKLNGESLLKMHLETARSKIATIPQDPHLFSGTVRHNLDPFEIYSDAEIWNALEDAHIKDHISQSGAGLACVVEESGKNFSAGQRQLLIMARAILRRSSVVLMDEVTANIDYQTDRFIQQSIRESPALRFATIITIAHRLRTVADSDIIVVMRNGEVLETGTPIELLNQSDSEFRNLAMESDEFDEILDIAGGERDP